MKMLILALVASFGVAQANPAAPAVDCKNPANAAKAECKDAGKAAPAAAPTATAPVKTAPVKQ